MSQNDSIWQRIRTSWFGGGPAPASASPAPAGRPPGSEHGSDDAASMPGIPPVSARLDERNARLSEDRVVNAPLGTPTPPPLPPSRRPNSEPEELSAVAGPTPGPRVGEVHNPAKAEELVLPPGIASGATNVPTSTSSFPSRLSGASEAAQSLRGAPIGPETKPIGAHLAPPPIPIRRSPQQDDFAGGAPHSPPPTFEPRRPAAQTAHAGYADVTERPTPTGSSIRSDGMLPATNLAAASATRTDAAVAQLQDGYARLLRMMGKMEEYFDSNEQRAEHMSRSVERFASTLDRLAETQQTQGESMRVIANSAERTGQLTVQLTEGVGALAESADRNGKLALQVSDSMSALAASADRNGHLSLQMSETLTQLPSSFQHVAETLRAVMERVGADQKHIVERLESGQNALVSRLDATQSGALQRYEAAQVTLGEQVDVLRDSQTALAQTLDRFGSAIEELTAASRANAETFKRIGLSEMEQRHMMTRLVGKLARRVTILVGVLGGLTLAALAMMIFLMMMSLDRPVN